LRNKLITLLILFPLVLFSCSPTKNTLASGEGNSTPLSSSPKITETFIINTPTKEPTTYSRSDCNELSIDWQATSSPDEDNNKYFASIPISAATSKTKEEIALALCCQYLEGFTSPKMGLERRINDYSIQLVRAEYLDDENGFVFSTNFQVLPFGSTPTFWIAGASMDLPNGWISRGAYARIKLINDAYVISSFWNG